MTKTKAKPKTPAVGRRGLTTCAGSGQAPRRRSVVDGMFGWCDDCGRWRRLIVQSERPPRLRTHFPPR